MVQDIYDPLEEYINVYRDRFADVAEKTFDELAIEAHIDIDANQKTCSQINSTQDVLANLKSQIKTLRICSVVLWIMFIVVLIVAIFCTDDLSLTTVIIISVLGVGSLLLLVKNIHPKLKALKVKQNNISKINRRLKKEAWEQMAPLNELYDWDIFTRMMSATVPKLEFDPYFTTQRLADLKNTYGWDDSFNAERSVVYSHSGLINGNPFVLCRTRKMEMGEKTYFGYKTIHWTTTERNSNGSYSTVDHSETLTASVTEPYPEYFEATRLIYGNTAAPDLIFNRNHSSLVGKEKSIAYKWKKMSLKRAERNLKNADYAMMSNEEFEVAFDTRDRNNNQEFALLFTPLAQENIMKLMKDHEYGYGDDFNFYKNKMINMIVPLHIQEENMEMNPSQYKNYDYTKAKEDFNIINQEYFRSIYFCLAPLLCVPMYQQIRSQQDIYGRDMQRHSSFWEHEALANFWGQDHFKHPSCKTDCILKTEQPKQDGDMSKIIVHAYGYRSEERLSYIKVKGGDGNYHSVPVEWEEYFPVTGEGEILMKEDNDSSADTADFRSRTNHIKNVVNQNDLNVYRRHIASKI